MIRENKKVSEMAGILNRTVRGVRARRSMMFRSEGGGSAEKESEGGPATEGGHEFGDMSLSTISASSMDRTDPTVDADLNRTATSEERRGLETLLRSSVGSVSSSFSFSPLSQVIS